MIFKILTLALVVTPLWAGDVTLSLREAPDYALRHNPELASAGLRIDEARARLRAAGRFANPELEFGVSQNSRRPERALSASLTQKFPVTARLGLEKAVSRHQLAAAEAEYAEAKNRLAGEVRTSAIRYLATEAQKLLREQQLGNSRKQTELFTQQIATGEASSIDSTQADLETRQLEVELLQLESERASIVGSLRALLGTPANSRIHITGELNPPGSRPSENVSAAQHPALSVARHNAEAAKQAEALEKAKSWEDIAVGLSGSRERMEDAPDGFSTDSFIGFKLSVPLPLWNRNEGRIAEAAAASARARMEAEALSVRSQSEVEAAREEMTALRRVLTAMDEGLLPKTTQVEEQLRASYNAGQTPLIEVLRARARTLEVSQRRVNLLRDYHLALVRYETALGRSQLTGGNPSK